MSCGETLVSCRCIRSSGHTGPHGCDCGGIWEGTVIYALPVYAGAVKPEEIDARVAKAVERGPFPGPFHLPFPFADKEEE